MRRFQISILQLVVCVWPMLAAQGQSVAPVDSAKSAMPKPIADSTQLLDTLKHDSAKPAISPAKLIPVVDSTGIKPPRKRGPRFDFFDSLVTTFASPRLNQRGHLDRSWFHDAGDYFKFSPAFVVRDYQDTPVRKTVQPYGLTGDRMNTIVNDLAVHPFEHAIEPDGMMDFNDLPTAWDDGVYILPGATGMIFGGASATATLLTRPQSAEVKRPLTELLVDKGQSGFSFARGRYAKAFEDGRKIDMAIGYRSAVNGWYGADDDASHYNGSFVWPTFANQAVTMTGYLYDRRGLLPVQPDLWAPFSAYYVTKHRFDRFARIGYQFWSPDRPSLWEFGYQHQRQGSFIDHDYTGQFDLTDNGLYARHDVKSGNSLVSAEFSADKQNYFDGTDNHDRFASEGSVTLARTMGGSNMGSRIGVRWSESHRVMPQLGFTLSRESDKFYLLASAGYAEREPSLHERLLKYSASDLYPNGSTFADSGNTNLKIERQAVGSLVVEIGKTGRALRFEATGGRIFDGIDWVLQGNPDTFPVHTFAPVNENINFATVSVEQTLAVDSFLTLHGGASYHYVTYDGDRHRPYQPDRNAFAGAELHYYWKPKLIDVWGYAEVVYLGPYDGYYESDIGNSAVINATVSFRMGNFRFHVLWQNLLATIYRNREYDTSQGRLISYGFTWNFFD
ncbi:MAG: hypothetical protein WAU88_05330 [Candidatus Zixiibacteriota bacterium]